MMTASFWKEQLPFSILLVATLCVFPWGGDLNAQGLPGWAEPQDSRAGASERSARRYEVRGQRADRPARTNNRWGASRQADRGGFRTRAPGGRQGPPQPCSTSKECDGYPNAYCGTNGKCFPNGQGPGNLEGSGQKPADVPIGGHGLWLILAGLGYGVRRLW